MGRILLPLSPRDNVTCMRRRDFLALPVGALGVSLARGGRQPRDADLTLRIAETSWELGPRRSIRTLTYNGQIPGPLVRVRAE